VKGATPALEIFRQLGLHIGKAIHPVFPGRIDNDFVPAIGEANNFQPIRITGQSQLPDGRINVSI
jgi:hypothetical protein